MTSKRGRPALNEREGESSVVCFRVPDHLRDAALAAAVERGVTLSVLARQALEDAIGVEALAEYYDTHCTVTGERITPDDAR